MKSALIATVIVFVGLFLAVDLFVFVSKEASKPDSPQKAMTPQEIEKGCHVLYLMTKNRRLADLDIETTQAVQTCAIAHMYN